MNRKFIPQDSEFIPGPGQVFVFGSNLAGIHGAGAARTALDNYGATWGRGEGLSGSSYAIPTKNKSLRSLTINEIKYYVDRFIKFAQSEDILNFFVTRIGCGLAGFTDYDIAPLFKDAPSNCQLPIGWRDFEEKYSL